MNQTMHKITESGVILYTLCTSSKRTFSMVLNSLAKGGSHKAPPLHILYCGDSALGKLCVRLSALDRISPAINCRTLLVQKGRNLRQKITPKITENSDKKTNIFLFDPAAKKPFRRVWKVWQYRAPKRHYRLVLSPLEKYLSGASFIVGDFTSIKAAMAAAVSIEAPDLYRLTIFNSRRQAVAYNAGAAPQFPEKVKRQAKPPIDATTNLHRPTTIEKLLGLHDRAARKGEYRSR